MKIHLALGGGGARGLYHIGVLKAFQKLKIKVNSLSGTSIGAMVGSVYALNPDATALETSFLDMLDRNEKHFIALKNYAATSNIEEKRIFLEKAFNFVKDLYLWNLRIIKPYLVEPRPYVKALRELIKGRSFNDCKTPFFVTGVDLKTGAEAFMEQGPLCRAVIASATIPGLFPPVKWHDKLLVDGGVLAPLPVKPRHKRVNYVIGVNLLRVADEFSEVNSAIDVLFLVQRIHYRKIVNANIKRADLLISPDIHSVSWADFDKSRELILRGEQETLNDRHRLLKAINKARVKKILFLR